MTRRAGAAFMGLIAVLGLNLRSEAPPAPASGEAAEAAVAFAEEELAETRRKASGN